MLLLTSGIGDRLIVPALPAALTELWSSTANRTKQDLTRASQVRIVTNVIVAVAGASLRAQYSTDNGGSWAYLDAASGPTLSVAATGAIASAYVAVTALARADVLLRFATINGDGTTDLELGVTELQGK